MPSISRRRFVGQLLVLGGLGYAGGLTAAERKSNPELWALFSDLHIAGDVSSVRQGINMANHLSEVGRELVSLTELPDHLLITGDLSSINGQPEDYATVKKLLRPIVDCGVPIYSIPGNHDAREPLREALPKLTESPDIPGKYAGIVRGQNVNWFLLDSSLKMNDSSGGIGEAQRQWLAQQLDANAATPAIVALHHPPIAAPGSSPALRDSAEFLEIIRSRKQVKACVFGHTHVYATTTDSSGIHLINLPAVSYPFDPKNPTGWVLATISKSSIRLEFHCSDKNHADNGKITDLKWRAED